MTLVDELPVIELCRRAGRDCPLLLVEPMDCPLAIGVYWDDPLALATSS